MNPHQKNKVDITKLSEDEQKLFRLYGKLPNRKDLLQNKLKERKYFDSGDYALSKAGKASDVGVTTIGHEHPDPENIPHAKNPSVGTPTGGMPIGMPTGGSNGTAGMSIPGATAGSPGIGGGAVLSPTMSGMSAAHVLHSHSPVKESRLQRETSADDVEVGEDIVDEPGLSKS